MTARLDLEEIAAIIELIPDAGCGSPGFDGSIAQRQAYLNYFKVRLASSEDFCTEAIHARAAHV